MTKKQLHAYETASDKVKSICGFGDGEIGGCAVHFEAGKGTWYIQGHGYLDDLAANDEMPDFLLANESREWQAYHGERSGPIFATRQGVQKYINARKAEKPKNT